MTHVKFTTLFITTLTLCCLFLCTLSSADDGDDDSGRDDAQVYHIDDNMDLVSTLKIQYEKPRIVVKSVYPQLESNLETDLGDNGIYRFNQLVIELAQQEITAFKNQVIENKATLNRLPASLAGKKNDLYIDYDTSVIQSGSSHIISIRFSMQGYIAGMAHPYHYHRVFNYDLENAEEVELNDLFLPNADYLTVLSDYTRNVLSRRLRNSDMVADGTAAKMENFSNWNIKPNGLLITFDEYRVAPYIAGAQTVLVPYSVLKNIISPNSAIAGCINHKKSCIRSNLLTGGFIDEATSTIKMRHRRFNPVLSKL